MINLIKDLGRGPNHYVFLVPIGTARRVEADRQDVEIIETDIAFKTPMKRLLWDQIYVRRFINEHNIDLLVSTSDFGLFFSSCPQILLIRNSLFFSKVYRERILIRKRLFSILDYWVRRFLVCMSIRSADRVIMASQAMRAMAIAEVPKSASKMVVNPFGSPLEKFSVAASRPPGNIKSVTNQLAVLYVSEYADYKNLGVLLRAIRYINQKTEINVRAVITMDPKAFSEYDSISKDEDYLLANDADVKSAVQFVGGVPYSKVQDLYLESDVFVFPSIAESFGHPLVEAMAAGLPVVASSIAVHQEVCGEAAIYFDPFDHLALASALQKLAASNDTRQKLQQAGLNRVRSQLSWTDHVRRLELQIVELGGLDSLCQ